MNLSYHSLTIAGPKGDNQDAFLEPVGNDDVWWCAIADGVGGSSGGGVAARLCIEAVRSALTSDVDMSELFESVSQYLDERSAEYPRMSSTLTVIRIAGSLASVGHVGDTRVSHYRGKAVMGRTHDQTEVQKLLDDGVISVHQAKRYPRRNVILSAMSPCRDYELYENSFEIEEGDRVVLSTDGFHEKLKRRVVARLSHNNASFEKFFSALEQEIEQIEVTDDATCIAIELS